MNDCLYLTCILKLLFKACFHVYFRVGWLTVSCFMSSDKYFMHIHDEFIKIILVCSASSTVVKDRRFESPLKIRVSKGAGCKDYFLCWKLGTETIQGIGFNVSILDGRWCVFMHTAHPKEYHTPVMHGCIPIILLCKKSSDS